MRDLQGIYRDAARLANDVCAAVTRGEATHAEAARACLLCARCAAALCDASPTLARTLSRSVRQWEGVAAYHTRAAGAVNDDTTARR